MTAISADHSLRPSAGVSLRHASRRQAFTLLEVLAAIAVLGIWYVIIASAAMQGLRREGESRRELEASLIADQRLADIEVGLDDGSVPEAGERKIEVDSFVVRVLVAPLTFGAARAPASPTSATAAAETGLAELGPLLVTEAPGLAGNLYRIRVDVLWPEGAGIGSVRRETFAFDIEKVREFIEKAKKQGITEESPLAEGPKQSPGTKR